MAIKEIGFYCYLNMQANSFLCGHWFPKTRQGKIHKVRSSVLLSTKNVFFCFHCLVYLNK